MAASWKTGAASKITSLAGPKSTGKCALVVRQAIQMAKGEPVQPTGIESAKDYGPWLIKEGYSSTWKTYSQASVGAVAVMAGSSAHPHGHICIKCADGRWRSDFVQNGFFPYADGSQPSYTIYE